MWTADSILETFVFPFAISLATLSVFLTALIPVLWIERKLAARLQGRVGPYEVGSPHGYLQPIADVLKLFSKADMIPTQADRLLFLFAPIWTGTCALWGVALIPFAPGLAAFRSDLSLVFLLAVASLPGLGQMAAGWASANKYALVSALRVVGQVAAFEIPLIAGAITPAIVYGSLDLNTLTEAQPAVGFFFGHPLGFPSFLLFLVGMLAEGNRTPFDIAEAESELIAGVTIEYSGMRFALFYIGEYGSLFLFGLLACVLWFGGFRGPFVPGPHWLLLKGFAFFCFVTILRWSFLRLRIDQFLKISWSGFVPASFLLVLLAVWWVG